MTQTPFFSLLTREGEASKRLGSGRRIKVSSILRGYWRRVNKEQRFGKQSDKRC